MQVEADDSFDPLSDFTRALDLHPAVKAWDDRMYIKEPLLKRVVGNTTQLNWFLMDQVFDWQRYPESEEVVCAV
jgi:L-rhamnose mutarotase